MEESQLIEGYHLFGGVQDRGICQTCTVINVNTHEKYFCKIIKGLNPSELAQKAFEKESYRLKRLRSRHINSLVDHGFIPARNSYFLIHPLFQTPTTMDNWFRRHPVQSKVDIERVLNWWINLAETLQIALESDITHQDIHPGNVLIHPDNYPVLIDFGIHSLSKTLSQTAVELKRRVNFTAGEVLRKENDPNPMKADLFSLGLCMLSCLIGPDTFGKVPSNENRKLQLHRTLTSILPEMPIEGMLEIMNRSIADEPGSRYSKYSDLVTDLRKFRDGISFNTGQPCYLWVDTSTDDIQAFVEELNEEGATIFIEEEKYHSHKWNTEQIKFRLATSSFFVSRGFLELNTLKCITLKRKNDLDTNTGKSYHYTFRHGRPVHWKFELVQRPEGTSPSSLHVLRLFEHWFEENKDHSSVSLVEKQRAQLNFYTQLLEGELEHLRTNAFSVTYSEFQEREREIHFSLNPKQGQNWNYVHQFVNKSNNHNREDVQLVVSVPSESKHPPKLGKAYQFITKKRLLMVRDVEIDTENIPPRNGELREDVSRSEVQFSRQLKAIQAFKKGLFRNNDLCAFLFNADQLPEGEQGLPTLSTVLSTDHNHHPFQLYPKQVEAVQKILHQEPMVMIQGPPGTGKTTVIVESILQILARNPEVKILVTSQSNFAVDNVLAKLSKANVPVIRLGDPQKIKQPDVRKAALGKRLQTWAKATKSSHEQAIKDLQGQVKLGNSLAYMLDLSQRKGSWENEVRPDILRALDRFKDQHYLIPHLNSRPEFEEALHEQVNRHSSFPNYTDLLTISRDWQTFLSNLSEKSDLITKLVENVNVIGATSNHIASSSYLKFDFDFDYVIMDEAGKATPAEALVPISMGRKIILVGDHLQLQPIVTTNDKLLEKIEVNREEELLEDPTQIYLDSAYPSLFEIMFKEAPASYKVALDVQRRMPEKVCRLISKHFYEVAPTKLTIKTAPEKKAEREGFGRIAESVALLDVGQDSPHQEERNSTSLFNEGNIQMIIDLLVLLDEEEGIEKHSIGIISGYTAQTRRIKDTVRRGIDKGEFQRLKLSEDLESAETGISIATIDSFQGLEKDIIIFDLVRSRPNFHLGFLETPNRINVAFSRVKKLLLIVGDIQRTLKAPRMYPHKDSEAAPIQKMIQEIVNAQKCYQNVEDLIRV